MFVVDGCKKKRVQLNCTLGQMNIILHVTTTKYIYLTIFECFFVSRRRRLQPQRYNMKILLFMMFIFYIDLVFFFSFGTPTELRNLCWTRVDPQRFKGKIVVTIPYFATKCEIWKKKKPSSERAVIAPESEGWGEVGGDLFKKTFKCFFRRSLLREAFWRKNWIIANLGGWVFCPSRGCRDPIDASPVKLYLLRILGSWAIKARVLILTHKNGNGVFHKKKQNAGYNKTSENV